ncbi:hypothetical protein AAFF_G00111810 [Aldrovandia affinis]|uniref:Uncharacterized protein n=1 Tax=Aldrovandia affinis TaxID=143900 RepID=A0AAD7RTM6_9TELE|nr:hypothetical protein AAFF_G00111810 [Aldrovandia affinis]
MVLAGKRCLAGRLCSALAWAGRKHDGLQNPAVWTSQRAREALASHEHLRINKQTRRHRAVGRLAGRLGGRGTSEKGAQVGGVYLSETSLKRITPSSSQGLRPQSSSPWSSRYKYRNKIVSP